VENWGERRGRKRTVGTWCVEESRGWIDGPLVPLPTGVLEDVEREGFRFEPEGLEGTIGSTPPVGRPDPLGKTHHRGL